MQGNVAALSFGRIGKFCLDFARDYQTLKQRGVTFARDPTEEKYGTVAVFQDLYGNKWDLLQLCSSR